MEEIRINNSVKIENSNKEIFEGTVLNIEYDRVYIQINPLYIKQAKAINELDELKITAETHFGLKTMHSSVISRSDKNNIIIVENNPADTVEQKREFMRVSCNFNFKITINDNEYLVNSKNISAGGISFVFNNKLELDQELKIKLPQDIFEKELICDAKIIKINEDNYVAQFINISENIESKIMKFVFKNVSKNSTGCEIG